MRDITCDCGAVHRGIRVFPLRCRCGITHPGDGQKIAPPINPLKRKPRLPCIHRGDDLGYVDCDCTAKPRMYQCELLDSPCMIRRLVAGPVLWMAESGRRSMIPSYCLSCSHSMNVAQSIAVDGAAIITPHFNPSGFNRLDETLREWLPTMPPGVIVERGDGTALNAMWQKERLINRAIGRLPAGVRYVVWCDHDLVFERADWLVQACQMIDSGHHAVQPFDTIKYLDRNGQSERTARGAASVTLQGGSPSTGPGGCWVASREWLDSIGGIYDRAVVGGGDAVWFEGVAKRWTRYRERQGKPASDHAQEWIDSIGAVRMGFVAGVVRHLWHGDFSNRQYVSRDAILKRWEFAPGRHVEIDSSGLLAWAEAAPQGLRDDVADYFDGRREDG